MITFEFRKLAPWSFLTSTEDTDAGMRVIHAEPVEEMANKLEARAGMHGSTKNRPPWNTIKFRAQRKQTHTINKQAKQSKQAKQAGGPQF